MANGSKNAFQRLWFTLRTILPFVIFVAAWEIAARGNQRLTFLFASPSLISHRFVHDLIHGELLSDIGLTAAETTLGFLIGCTIGSLVGLTLWLSEATARMARPYVVAAGAIPIFAVAPMMIIWFGTGIFAKIMMAALSTVVVAIFQAYEGAQNVDPDLVSLLKTFGASKWQTYRKVVIPASLVWVVASYKINVGFALLGAFIGEFISSERGLGHYILQGGGLYDVPQVLTGVTCIVCLSLTMSALLGFAERWLLPWRHNQIAREMTLATTGRFGR